MTTTLMIENGTYRVEYVPTYEYTYVSFDQIRVCEMHIQHTVYNTLCTCTYVQSHAKTPSA